MIQHGDSFSNSNGAQLPEALSSRWQPLRGCLLNIYRYDYEEFRYEEGRLLLRGNNGTGKSRVLALQLPFLLDGDISAHRLEPDGDPAKRMEWNLLLSKHQDRLGYTCIEFGRRDPDGTCHYLTLGCGLHAVEHRGIHGKWFFITGQRIGQDLFLANSRGQPLGRTQLEAAIGDQGEVFVSAESYRHAVDRALFRLGDRYSTLVELLIRLRQPKLSKVLDEEQLSAALSDALPPISSNVLDDVAEAFGTLESDRRRLDDFTAAREAVQAFLLEYRAYVQIAARRRAETVRKTHSEYEATQRRLRKAESDHELALQELKAAEANLARLKEEERAADEVVQTLSSSPQMSDARELDEARQQVAERSTEVTRTEADHQQAIIDREQSDAEADAARKGENFIGTTLERVKNNAQNAASAIALTRHPSVIDKLGLPQIADAKTIENARKSGDDLISHHHKAIQRLKNTSQSVEKASAELKSAQEGYSNAESRLCEATEVQRTVHGRLKQASEELLAGFDQWISGLRELALECPERLAEELADWCESGEGDFVISARIRAAVRAATESLNNMRSERQQQLSQENERLRSLQEQFRRIDAGHHEPPPLPHTRGSDARVNRPGAPLWSLCDFRSDMPDDQRAAIEAAMEAAGLLDAWVTPDGKLFDATQQDTVLVTGTSPLPPATRHLGLALSPVDRNEAPVPAPIVAEVLRHIGFGSESGPINVDASGRWQLGPLHGVWSKPLAQHIGPASRENARIRRLAELTEAIHQTRQAIENIQQEINDIAIRVNLAHSEESSAPAEEPIRKLHTELTLASRAVDDARLRLKDAEQHVEFARKAWEQAKAILDRDAHDLGLFSWINRLSELDDAFTKYREVMAELWPTLHSFYNSQQQTKAAAHRAAIAQNNERNRADVLSSAREKLAGAKARCDTLETTKGVEVAAVLKSLEEARKQRQHLKKELDQELGNQTQIWKKLGETDSSIKGVRELLEQHSNNRDNAIEILKAFSATRLLVTAHENLSAIEVDAWSVARAVEIARLIESTLSSVSSDDMAWERNQREIHQHIELLKDALLPHSYSPVTRNTEEGVFVVSVPFQGREHEMVEFLAALSAEIQHHQMILDAKEREVLENHLVGEVATHLHELLHSAERLVRDMSNEIHARPTSTGMKLRFTWQPMEDGPPGLQEARKRLFGHGGTWSTADRTALGEFLQERIKDVRLANQTGTWHEHLAEAFDYRKWHRFGIERHQDGHWKPLNKKTYGTGSSGEKAIALTLPMLAAAAASYRSADPLAPRLILLDEAFVSIDGDMRKKCMGLLHTFDLDFVMTSEHEWGCYPTLPALAIYQLSTLPSVDAVGVTRWVWNGRERKRDQYQAPIPCSPNGDEVTTFSNGNGNDNDSFRSR